MDNTNTQQFPGEGLTGIINVVPRTRSQLLDGKTSRLRKAFSRQTSDFQEVLRHHLSISSRFGKTNIF
jgi:hypothetical protein